MDKINRKTDFVLSIYWFSLTALIRNTQLQTSVKIQCKVIIWNVGCYIYRWSNNVCTVSVYVWSHASWSYTCIYLDGEHSTLTKENVQSAIHSCRSQMVASIKTNKIDKRVFILSSIGVLKKMHGLTKNSFCISPTTLMVIYTCVEILNISLWICDCEIGMKVELDRLFKWACNLSNLIPFYIYVCSCLLCT